MYIFLVNVYCFGKQNRCFCYKTTEEIQNNAELLEELKQKYLGSIIEVDFAKKTTTGIILSCNVCKIENNCVNINGKSIELTKIKPINKVLCQNLLTEQFLQFLSYMAFYYVIETEKLIQLVIPSFWIKKKKDVLITQKAGKNKKTEASTLSTEQQQISSQLFAEKNKFGVSVLRGVMGSGKTYVFLDVVKKILAEDNDAQALIMVPEIALTEQLMEKIYQICGLEAIIWHSSISNAKKKQYYEMIISGKVKIIVSTRSGVLLPYKNLKIIVIDEEHDNSYKQDEVPSYQARDMAILRGKYENFPVILTSATPSIETINNVLLKKYKIFNLNSQFFNIKPPEILLIDNDFGKKNTEESKTTDNQKDITYNLSRTARQALIETKQKKEQSLVFINRRGYSRTLKCNSCGYEVKCRNCDNLLSYHKKNNILKCHYCGFKIQNYSKCECCGEKELLPNGGIGVEQIQKEIENFLQCNTMVFSSDEINKDTDVVKLTNEIKNGDIDVIIGTQIITKGHHFPNLTTIIVLDIDGIALSGDFRAYEKMFQMLFQLSGRAGREKHGAKIYIQTNNKNNVVLQKLQQHDLEGFYKQELLQRKQFFLPPFSRFISVIVASQDKTKANTTAEKVKQKLLTSENENSDIKILGPTESQLHFLKKNYRYRFLIISKKTQDVFVYLNKVNLMEFNSKMVQVKIDVDPYSFL